MTDSQLLTIALATVPNVIVILVGVLLISNARLGDLRAAINCRCDDTKEVVRAEINAVRMEIVAGRGGTEALRAEVTALRAEIAAGRAETKALRAEIDRVRAEIHATRGNPAVRSEVRTLKAGISTPPPALSNFSRR